MSDKNDWRNAGPQIEAERAKMIEYEARTAHMTREECNAIIDSKLVNLSILTCHGRNLILCQPLDDLRSLAAEVLYLQECD
jgi:hypothetical protein